MGLPALTIKERMQLWIGDSLIRFLVKLLLLAARMGLAGFMEHPQYPTWCAAKKPPSVWSWKAIQHMKNLQCSTFVSFDQCVVGADACKPTTLMLIRLPAIRRRLLQSGNNGRCNHPRGFHKGLVGRQADGTFETARAKIYPGGLNMVIAEEMVAFAHKLGTCHRCHVLAGGISDFFPPTGVR